MSPVQESVSAYVNNGSNVTMKLPVSYVRHAGRHHLVIINTCERWDVNTEIASVHLLWNSAGILVPGLVLQTQKWRNIAETTTVDAFQKSG